MDGRCEKDARKRCEKKSGHPKRHTNPVKFSSAVISAFLSFAYASGCQQIAGNTYCNEVSEVTYQNIGFAGSYNAITGMDSSSCTCSSAVKAFSGPLAPLNEELSISFRGPVSLKQFAVYYPNSGNAKRDAVEEEDKDCGETAKREFHAHHAHKRGVVTEIVQVTQVVYADQNGFAIQPSDALTYATQTGAPTAGPSYVGPPQGWESLSSQTQSIPSSTIAVPSNVPSQAPVGNSDWKRSAFYSSSSGQSDGLTFLNHQGGTAGSGTWDSCFGNSLSFCGTDGVSGAGSPQVLGDVTIPSNKEFLIMSDKQCGGNDCGYVREGSPAYHGFGGTNKIFLFEFSMPKDNSQGFNADMPAIWMLNAQIPRTLQYGQASCSCWTTGCGELDLFEVLNSGNDRLTNHLHTWQGTGTQYGGGGSADYFTRPTSGTLKAAVIFSGDNSEIKIVQLDDSTDFASGLNADQVQQWIGKQQAAAFVKINS